MKKFLAEYIFKIKGAVACRALEFTAARRCQTHPHIHQKSMLAKNLCSKFDFQKISYISKNDSIN